MGTIDILLLSTSPIKLRFLPSLFGTEEIWLLKGGIEAPQWYIIAEHLVRLGHVWGSTLVWIYIQIVAQQWNERSILSSCFQIQSLVWLGHVWGKHLSVNLFSDCCTTVKWKTHTRFMFSDTVTCLNGNLMPPHLTCQQIWTCIIVNFIFNYNLSPGLIWKLF
jgi:hypothetical protein